MPTRVLTLFVILSLNARRASAVGLTGVDVAEDVSLIDPELEYDDSQVIEALDHASMQQLSLIHISEPTRPY